MAGSLGVFVDISFVEHLGRRRAFWEACVYAALRSGYNGFSAAHLANDALARRDVEFPHAPVPIPVPAAPIDIPDRRDLVAEARDGRPLNLRPGDGEA